MDVGLLFIVTWDSLCDLYPRLQMQLKELQEKPCVSSGSKPDVGNWEWFIVEKSLILSKLE